MNEGETKRTKIPSRTMEDKSVIACSIFFYFVGVIEISGIEMLNESKKEIY